MNSCSSFTTITARPFVELPSTLLTLVVTGLRATRCAALIALLTRRCLLIQFLAKVSAVDFAYLTCYLALHIPSFGLSLPFTSQEKSLLGTDDATISSTCLHPYFMEVLPLDPLSPFDHIIRHCSQCQYHER